MTTEIKPANFYADFGSLAALKGSAQQQDPNALREVARQFESLFTQMMLKSMRQASLGESLIDNDQSDFYREMFDNQMASQLSKGRGLGLADMLVRQLSQGKIDPNAITNSGKPLGNSPSEGFALPDSKTTPPSLPVPAAKPNGQSLTNPETVSPTARPQPIANSRAEFVEKMWPHAQAAARELGVDANTLIAHAALETGWGKFVPCNPDGTCSFNLFGVKATSQWKGSAVAVNTLEYEGGVAVKQVASFRAYASPEESFRDYAALIKNNSRYAAALGSKDNTVAFATALQQGGYATDPSYAAKLVATAATLKSLPAATPLKTSQLQPLLSARSGTAGGST